MKELKKNLQVGESVHFNLESLIKTNEKYEPKLDYPISLNRRRSPKSSVNRSSLYKRFFQILKDKSERGEFDIQ